MVVKVTGKLIRIPKNIPIEKLLTVLIKTKTQSVVLDKRPMSSQVFRVTGSKSQLLRRSVMQSDLPFSQPVTTFDQYWQGNHLIMMRVRYWLVIFIIIALKMKMRTYPHILNSILIELTDRRVTIEILCKYL